MTHVERLPADQERVAQVVAGEPLRESDIVPFRRALGRRSAILRVDDDGSIQRIGSLPAMLLDAGLHHALFKDEAFEAACRQAIASGTRLLYPVERGESAPVTQVVLSPVFDDRDTEHARDTACRYLLCWVRSSASPSPADLPHTIELNDIHVRYRHTASAEAEVIDAEPWWVDAHGELRSLQHLHEQLDAVGLGHSVMETLITDAAVAAAVTGSGPAVRVCIPSAGMLAGAVPLFHGALRLSGLDPQRLMVAVDVNLASDANLRPILVHLRTMGLLIDVIGLDEHLRQLHRLSSTSDLLSPAAKPGASAVHDATAHGPWHETYADALAVSV